MESHAKGIYGMPETLRTHVGSNVCAFVDWKPPQKGIFKQTSLGCLRDPVHVLGAAQSISSAEPSKTCSHMKHEKREGILITYHQTRETNNTSTITSLIQ